MSQIEQQPVCQSEIGKIKTAPLPLVLTRPLAGGGATDSAVQLHAVICRPRNVPICLRQLAEHGCRLVMLGRPLLFPAALLAWWL